MCYVPTIWLRQDNKKANYFLGGEDGKIDTTINPGSYRISINAAGYKSFDTIFSVGDKTIFHFNIILIPDPMPTIYEVDSRRELTPLEINRVKACVFKGKDLLKCSKKKIYYVVMQI